MREDFNAFLNLDDFAVQVRSEIPDRTFAAVFDNESILARLGGMELESTTPTMETRVEYVSDFVRGSTLVYVPGIDTPFIVDRVKPDGTGWALVELVP